MYKLYLVNHTQIQYTELCRSNFSQERCPFIVPMEWDADKDDMEIMTEFVFREKLKNRHKFEQVDMFPDPDLIDDDDEDGPGSEQEDLKDDMRQKYTSKSNEVPDKKSLKEKGKEDKKPKKNDLPKKDLKKKNKEPVVVDDKEPEEEPEEENVDEEEPEEEDDEENEEEAEEDAVLEFVTKDLKNPTKK